MKESKNTGENVHTPSNRKEYDYDQLFRLDEVEFMGETVNSYKTFQQEWHVDTTEEYELKKQENPFYDGDRERQFYSFFHGEVEYKTESRYNWFKNGNLFIEYLQRFKKGVNKDGYPVYTDWQESGISTSTSVLWVHHCFDEDYKPLFPFIIPTNTLRSWIRTEDFAIGNAPHLSNSGTLNRGYLIPIDFVLSQFPMPHNHQLTKQKMEEATKELEKKEEQKRNDNERVKEVVKDLFKPKVVVGVGKDKKDQQTVDMDVDMEQLTDGNVRVRYTSPNGEIFTQLYDTDMLPLTDLGETEKTK